MPQGHDVIIQVKACVLDTNHVHLSSLFRELFLYDELPDVPVSTEVSGVVSQVGPDVTRFSVGDDVVGMLSPSPGSSGACASFCTVSEYNIVKKPSKVTYADAACCVGNGLQAFTALHYKANLCGGETVLVMNGASGAGIMAIQLAQLWGAKIITTAHSEEEKLFLESWRPEIGKIIDYTKLKIPLVDDCLNETAGTGVDCIIDNGVDQFPKTDQNTITDIPTKHELVSCLAVGGRWITTQSDLQLDPPHSKMLYMKGASLSFLFKDVWTLSKGQQGRFLHILTEVLDKVETGTLKPVVHHTVNFEDAISAIKNLHNFPVGNVVLVV
ncbi:quinone oxidoreductase-like protein 1 isoform X2 [Dendronephthya gigantea]|nr:quinone oxidoreductase-like protein 1 isoform X2 [Dendronephthya gigantea]